MRIVEPSEPGWPEDWVTVTPAESPCRADEASMTGRREMSSPSMVEMAPVRLTFFCTP